MSDNDPGPGRRAIPVDEYAVSDGWRTVKVEPITTSTKYLVEQIKVVGKVCNRVYVDGRMPVEDQKELDALIHWLTEILEQAKGDDTVVLDVVE